MNGQWEAALSGAETLRDLAYGDSASGVAAALLPLGNFFIGLFEETPLLAAITVIDVFGAANGIAGRAIRYIEPYTLVAIILLAISLIAACGLRRLEARFLRPGR